ncbi:MAG: hypothetical protein OXC41_02300 [Gammaproteobacteria bacterium]|nr:hypothetical protein [Gammaproteobacteria bacterium]
MAQIFDIHATFKDLVASGFNEQQAEAITTVTPTDLQKPVSQPRKILLY